MALHDQKYLWPLNSREYLRPYHGQKYISSHYSISLGDKQKMYENMAKLINLKNVGRAQLTLKNEKYYDLEFVT